MLPVVWAEAGAANPGRSKRATAKAERTIAERNVICMGPPSSSTIRGGAEGSGRARQRSRGPVGRDLALPPAGSEKMRRKLSKYLMGLFFLAPLLAVACGTTYSPPPPTSTGDLEGSRYETMRVLSGRLVDRLQGTRDELRAAREAESEMGALADLIEKARRFRDSMENYSNPPRYVRDDVNELDRLARDLESRTRDVRVSTRAYDNWRGALDVIDRMQRLLAGQNVDIPPATGPTTGTGGSTYPTYPSTGTYGSILTGTTLEDFRRTAHEVVVRGTLARDTAERSGTIYNDADRRLLSDLSYFLTQAR